MAWLVDTNVLVYRHDARYPDKQKRARELLRSGLASGETRIPHQAIVEFVAATTRPIAAGPSLLEPGDARRHAEDLLNQFTVLYPTEELVRLALRAMPAYGLSWFDAHLWAYAEFFGLRVLYSEDFQHERTYGTVQVLNPFVA